KGFGSLASFFGLAEGAAVGLTAGVGALLGGLLAVGRVLEESARYYVEHSKAAKGLRDELDRVGETFDTVKLIVGGSLVQPEQSALIGFLKLGEEWAIRFGVKLAADIELARRLAYAVDAWLPGGTQRGQQRDIDEALATALSGGDVSKLLGGAHPVGS